MIRCVPRIFVSHASADSALVDPFVDAVLRLGCGVKQEELFYSSGEDTGVPDGYDLLHHVREQVSEAGLVVAIVTSTFQTRPVCVAELGAAWSRAGNLFPLAVPGMSRTDMEGVLAGMTVRYIDDSAALDALHQRIGEVLGEKTGTPTWGRYKASWLTNVGGYVAGLSEPEVVSREDMERVEGDLVGAREALAATEAQCHDLEDRIKKLAAAKTAEERSDAMLPTDEKERFLALVKMADDALRELDPIVRDAVYYDLVDGNMAWPDPYDDKHRADAAAEAVHRGDLKEDSDGHLVLDAETTLVASAAGAVWGLQQLLRECSEDFDTWFREQYGGPPDLRRRRVWDGVIL
jgi:hypothetical protein